MFTSSTSKAAIWATLFSMLFTLAASGAPTANCNANITVNSTYPNHAFYIYNDIIVENVGSCGISTVKVDITIPPGDTVFAYINITNSTGKLTGLDKPMPQGSVQVGGTIVLSSARTPFVTLKSITCVSTCASSPTSSPTIAPVTVPPATAPPATVPPATTPPAASSSSSEDDPTLAPNPATPSTLQLSLLKGSNPFFLALNILNKGKAISMEEVMFTDSGSYSNSWHYFAKSNWGNAPTYSFSPTNGPLTPPLSLILVSSSGELGMHDVIASFNTATIDTGVEYIQSV